MSASDTFQIRVERSVAAVPAAEWDACANPAPDAAGSPPSNPFLSHSFLLALEESGCVGGRTGWQPCHLVLGGEAEKPLAVMPCYLKSHSQGEYVFDHGWADAYERAGGRYYPKLQAAVPFTPATGRRLLVREGVDHETAAKALAAGACELARRQRGSSVHVTFATQAEWRLLGSLGFLQRTDQQFHWSNAGYGSFEQFLETLASRKRKAIRRERRDALAGGITIEHVTGRDITEAHWDAFFAFYMDTGSRKWGRPYLNRRFFSAVGERMAQSVLLVMARRAGRYIAGAINFIGGDALYGRNWGCVEHHPFLHFEVCYYQAIDFAIARGLARAEAGAQGAHKLARGYLPATTYSAHWIADPSLERAIADYLKRERQAVALESRELAELSPFRRGERTDEAARAAEIAAKAAEMEPDF